MPRGDGTKRQVDAYNRIRRMVRRDASGTEYCGATCPSEDGRAGYFEKSQLRPMSPELVVWLEAGNYHRRAIDQNWGGRGKRGIASAGSRRPHFVRVYHQATPSKRLPQLLWEPVRLAGIGVWCRDAGGVWNLARMQVQSYERLEEEDATLTIERLRGLEVELARGCLGAPAS